MWRVVLLYSLVRLTLADNGWKVGEQYIYDIEARTLTGQYQIANQFTGTIICGKLQVFVDSENQLTFQVHKTKYADINQNLQEGWATHIPENEVIYRNLPAINKPFQIHLVDGMIQKLVVDRDTPIWELNFIKGIASQFQMVIPEKYSKLTNDQRDYTNSNLFSTMEESISGKYETVYEISMLPEYILQSRLEFAPSQEIKGDDKYYKIVKTRNFSNSDQHIVYRFGMSGQEGWNEATNTMRHFLTRTSQSTIIYSGNYSQFTIHSTETTDTILAAPHMHDNQKAIVKSRMKLSLQQAIATKGPSPLIINPKIIDSLVYIHKHGPSSTQDDEKLNDLSSSSSSSEEEQLFNNTSISEEEQFWNDREGKMANAGSPQSTGNERTVRKDQLSTSSQNSPNSATSLIYELPGLNAVPNNEFMSFTFNQQLDRGYITKKIEEVAKEIGKLLNNPNELHMNNVLSRFSILTRLVLSANTKELLQISETLYHPDRNDETDLETHQNHRTWKAYRDAVAEAGNGPALVTIYSWIKSGKVKGNEAAQLLSVLPRSARYPTTEYMNYFFDLMKSKEVQSQKYLNDSAILSFTDLVRRSQVDSHTSRHRYPIRLSGSQSPNHYAVVGEQYIPYLQRQLENAIAQDDSIKIQVYIRALGNTAHPKILAVFEPYLEGKRLVSNFQRFLMLESLDDFIKVHPSTARSVLYRIYKNQFEISELRIAAVMQIMKTNPSAHLLQSMAEQTNYDENKQVNSAVKSAIETAAKSDPTVDPSLVQKARSAMDFLSLENYGARYSKHFINSYFMREVENIQYTAYGSSVQGIDGIYPDTILFTKYYNIGGYYPEKFTASYMTSGAEQIVNLVLKLLEFNNNTKGTSPYDAEADERNRTHYTFQYLSEMLNWQMNEPTNVEGNIFGTLMGGERFFPLDLNTIEQLPNIFRAIHRNLQDGIDWQGSKFYNHYSVEMGFPLTTGVQFTYSLNVPTYLHLAFIGNGYLHQTQENTRNNNIPISGGINGNFKFIWSNQKSGKIGFIAQHSQKRYHTVLEKNTQLYIPLRGSLDVNCYNIRASLKFDDEEKEFQKLFQLKSNVFNTYQDITDVKPYQEGSNVQFISIGPKRTFRNTFGYEQTGYMFQVELESEDNFQAIGRAFYAFLQQGPEIFSENLYSGVSDNQVVLSYISKNSSAHETTLSFTYKDQEPDAGKLISEIQKKKIGARKGASNGDGLEISTSKEINGNYTTTMSLLAASVSFGEVPEKGRYVATLVHADSPVSTSSRYVIFYCGEPFHKSKGDEQFQATAEVIINKPHLGALNLDDALSFDSTTIIEGEINFDKPNQSKLEFQGQLMQSEKRKQHLLNHPSAQMCKQNMKKEKYHNPFCARLIENLHYYDLYNVSLHYDQLPTVVKQFGEMFYRIARHYGSDYNVEEVIDVLNEEGKIKLQVKFAENLNNVNVSITAPSFESYFEEVPVEDWSRPMVVQHPKYSPIQLLTRNIIYSQQTPTCTLEANVITTFNNKTYPVELGDCFHVLSMTVPFKRLRAQKISQEYDYDQRNFSILVKDAGSNKKMVQVLLAKDTVELEPSGPRKLAFIINNRKVQISEKKITGWSSGKNELYAYILQPDIVVLDIESHGMQLMYDGRRVQLTLSSHYSNKVRGLCGVFDGETYRDFTTPRNCIMKNHPEFAASYAINDETCQGPAKEMNILSRNVPCYSKETMAGDVISDREAGRLNHSESLRTIPAKNIQGSCYIVQVKAVKDGGNTCFSIRQQLLCNHHCKATMATVKAVDFICLPDSVATKHWLSMVHRGISPDFTKHIANRQMNVSLPETCVMK